MLLYRCGSCSARDFFVTSITHYIIIMFIHLPALAGWSRLEGRSTKTDHDVQQFATLMQHNPYLIMIK